MHVLPLIALCSPFALRVASLLFRCDDETLEFMWGGWGRGEGEEVREEE